jgi:hypothetical protein
MRQTFTVVPAGTAKLEKRERVGFDASLRKNSKCHDKYLRAAAVHVQSAVWAKPTGVTTLVKVGPRVPKMATKLAQLQDKFNNR